MTTPNENEIINRVANSALITIDLEDYYPKGERLMIDLSDWLYEGLLLKEKEFRQSLKEHDWAQYQNALVALHCSTDAILPGWAYLLVTTYVQPYAKALVIGNQEDMNQMLYQKIIENLDMSPFRDQRVIIKGCNRKTVPQNAYIHLASKLLPIVKSLMYGEACSTVPLYKKV